MVNIFRTLNLLTAFQESLPRLVSISLCWLLAVTNLPVPALAQTKVDAPTQIKRLAYIDVRGFQNADGTLAHPNDPTACNDVAINAAIALAPFAGGFVLIGEGEWWVCATMYIPSGVTLVGSGWGQPSIFSSTIQGTVLSASSSFTTGYTGNNFSKNWILAINGNGTRDGTGNAPGDTFGAGAWNMSVNCNNVVGCGALYKGHANEQSGYHYITTQNFTLGGLYSCGGGMGSTGYAVCGAASGSQQDGPDDNLQFYPSPSMASTSPIIMLSGVLNYRGLNNVTISGFNSSHTAGYAGYIGGTLATMNNVHVENVADGFHLGDSDSHCPGACNGLQSFTATNVDLTPGGGGAVPATNATFYIANVAGSHFGQIQGGGASCGPIHYNQNLINQCTVSNQILGNFDIDPLKVVRTDDATFEYYLQSTTVNGQLISSGASNQFVLKSSVSPFYQSIFNEDGSSNLTITSTGNKGNFFYDSPYAVFGLTGNTANLAGLNLQTLIGAPSESGVRGAFCPAMYWDTTNLVWQFANIGSVDYACAFMPAGGGFAVTAGYVSSYPTTLTDATFLANQKLIITPNGRLFSGSGINTLADTGAQVQILGDVTNSGAHTVGGVLNVTGAANLNGGATVTGALNATGSITTNAELFITTGGLSNVGFLYSQGNAEITGNTQLLGTLATAGVTTVTTAGNTDNKGQLGFTSSNNSSTYVFSGTYSHEPVCVTSFDGGVVNGYTSPILALSGSTWTLVIHANLNVTATGNYICQVTP